MAFSTIQGSGGAPDSFVGTSGVDSITLIDSLGNFDLVAKGADDVVTILATEDVVTSDASARGGDGNDTFLTLGDFSQVFNNSFFNGNAGNDALNFSGDTLAGTTLLGGKGDDIITTGAAISSRFNGNIGDDTLTIDGISSNSSFYGGQDDDTINIVQNVTNSLISGDDGDDEIEIVVGGSSVEGSTLSGGDGDDVIDADQANSSVLIDGGDGDDQLIGGDEADTISGGDGDDTIFGRDDADMISVGDGATTIQQGILDSVVATVVTTADVTLVRTIAANDSITFGNDVDVITGFDTTDDILTVDNSTPLFSLLGEDALLLSPSGTFKASGNFNSSTGKFTILADGTGLDTLVLQSGVVGSTSNALTTNESALILLDVNSRNLVASNFNDFL